MADCTDAERQFLDDLNGEDCTAWIVLFNEGRTFKRWMKHINNPPLRISIDFADGIGDDGRIVRKITCGMGVNAKEYKEIVAEAQQVTTAAPDETPSQPGGGER